MPFRAFPPYDFGSASAGPFFCPSLAICPLSLARRGNKPLPMAKISQTIGPNSRYDARSRPSHVRLGP
jgi:hypothetical protein